MNISVSSDLFWLPPFSAFVSSHIGFPLASSSVLLHLVKRRSSVFSQRFSRFKKKMNNCSRDPEADTDNNVLKAEQDAQAKNDLYILMNYQQMLLSDMNGLELIVHNKENRNLYIIKASLGNVRSIPSHMPPLGWRYIIVVLSSGLAFCDSGYCPCCPSTTLNYENKEKTNHVNGKVIFLGKIAN
ncbi:RabGAP/TBC domain-containing protein [Carex littledalei]|uniref:RabGAP/TBC domain-containing protein n=1 Tax=Carex littledalei TaxID=544730 RepID=A0A833REU0_9POAL|nr:RabGAP/TBC domain-containing protein [Carex littledalei]